MDQDIPQSSNEQQLLEEVVRCRELVLQNPCEHKADLAAVLYNLGELDIPISACSGTEQHRCFLRIQ